MSQYKEISEINLLLTVNDPYSGLLDFINQNISY